MEIKRTETIAEQRTFIDKIICDICGHVIREHQSKFFIRSETCCGKIDYYYPPLVIPVHWDICEECLETKLRPFLKTLAKEPRPVS